MRNALDTVDAQGNSHTAPSIIVVCGWPQGSPPGDRKEIVAAIQSGAPFFPRPGRRPYLSYAGHRGSSIHHTTAG